MSKQKHKSYRQVLHTFNSRTTYAGQDIGLLYVVWAFIDGQTSRTVKSSHIGVSCYVDSVKFKGTDVWMPRKAVSMNLRKPIESLIKHFGEASYKRALQDSFNKAYLQFLMAPERSQNLKGQVICFDKVRGQGMVRCLKSGHDFVVYACNMNGKKTWYAETACTYVDGDQEVTFNLADMGDHLTACITQGQKFDAEKWASLDQSRLALKCSENGELESGLFAK